MWCSNCGKQVPDDATMCQFCEAVIEPDPPDEVKRAIMESVYGLDPELRKELFELMARCKTAEEFTNRILVGNCPKCDSEDTDNCQNDPDVEDITVGRCAQCGHLWCTVCHRPYKGTTCPCMKD